MANFQVIQLTKDNFSTEVLQNSTAVLVHFGASWESACRMVKPVLDDLASEKRGRVKIAYLDIDNYPGTADQYLVKTIPAYLLFRNGEVLGRLTGATRKAELERFFDQHL